MFNLFPQPETEATEEKKDLTDGLTARDFKEFEKNAVWMWMKEQIDKSFESVGVNPFKSIEDILKVQAQLAQAQFWQEVRTFPQVMADQLTEKEKTSES